MPMRYVDGSWTYSRRDAGTIGTREWLEKGRERRREERREEREGERGREREEKEGERRGEREREEGRGKRNQHTKQLVYTYTVSINTQTMLYCSYLYIQQVRLLSPQKHLLKRRKMRTTDLRYG